MRNLKPQKQIRPLDFLLYVSAWDFKSISFLFLSMLKFQKKSEPCWTSDFLLSMFQLKNFFFLVCWSSREIWASVQDFGIVISMLQRVPVELSNLSVRFCPSMLNSKRILRSVFVIFCIFRIRVLFSHFQDKRNRPYDFQLEDIILFLCWPFILMGMHRWFRMPVQSGSLHYETQLTPFVRLCIQTMK